MTQQPEPTSADDSASEEAVGDVKDPIGDLTDTGVDDDAGSGAAGVGSPEKDPADWVTGDEPPTGPQTSYLGTLAREAGVEVPDDLTKAQASELIDELQSRTGRGKQ